MLVCGNRSKMVNLTSIMSKNPSNHPSHLRYHSWSFIYSPCWVQIKCELRILSQFAFNLNPDWELPLKKANESQPLKDGVRDMLVKDGYHLFSWDL